MSKKIRQMFEYTLSILFVIMVSSLPGKYWVYFLFKNLSVPCGKMSTQSKWQLWLMEQFALHYTSSLTSINSCVVHGEYLKILMPHVFPNCSLFHAFYYNYDPYCHFSGGWIWGCRRQFGLRKSSCSQFCPEWVSIHIVDYGLHHETE